MQATNGQCVILIVLGGDKGNGFSVHATEDYSGRIPGILRTTADEVEKKESRDVIIEYLNLFNVVALPNIDSQEDRKTALKLTAEIKSELFRGNNPTEQIIELQQLGKKYDS